MNFLVLFFICFILLVIFVSVFGFLLQNIWALIAIIAFILAIFFYLFIRLDERIERIENLLGIQTDFPNGENPSADIVKENDEKDAP